MGFESLMGNRQMKEDLSRSLEQNRIAHFYLISGPVGSGKKTLAKLLSAAILCQGKGKPCGVCPGCRKALEGVHPDVITVDDPEHKNVSVDVIRKARADVYIQPNEADRKVYILPRAQDMLPPAQNALLKILGEPPVYGVFLLLTDNPDKLLPTIRSRCRELKLTALPEGELTQALAREFPKAEPAAVTAAVKRSGGFYGQARALLTEGAGYPPQTESFAESFGAKDHLGLTQTLVGMEKWKRDQLIPVLQQWIELLEGALAHQAGGLAVHPLSVKIGDQRSGRELLSAILTLQKCTEYAQGNISPAAICGHLVWALR